MLGVLFVHLLAGKTSDCALEPSSLLRATMCKYRLVSSLFWCRCAHCIMSNFGKKGKGANYIPKIYRIDPYHFCIIYAYLVHL